jgi:5-methylcytosine-specific restriction endonuclease McrA
MATYLSPGCHNDKAHVCDFCESDDGRPTLYWPKKDFDLCNECILRLYKEYLSAASPVDIEPTITVSRMAIPEELRNRVYKRDGYKCRHCNATEYLTIDHIFPFIKGGKTEEANFQTLCRSCNSKKRDKVTGVKING